MLDSTGFLQIAGRRAFFSQIFILVHGFCNRIGHLKTQMVIEDLFFLLFLCMLGLVCLYLMSAIVPFSMPYQCWLVLLQSHHLQDFPGLEWVVMHRESCLSCGTAKFCPVRGIRSKEAGPAVGVGVKDTAILV